MTRMPRSFQRLCASLIDAGVEFLIVGGYFVAYHGYARTTGDLDLCVAAYR